MADMSSRKIALAKRLYLIQDSLGLQSQKEFAEKFGISVSYASDVLSGKKAVGEQLLFALVNEGVDLNWLLSGTEGSPFRPGATGASSAIGTGGPEDLVYVSRRAVRVSAGEGAVVLDEQETGREPFSLQYWKENFNVSPEKTTIVTVDGDSMAPTLLPGQPVMVNISDGQPPADGLWVVRIDDGVFVKRVQFVGGGKLMVISDNPAYQSREYDRDNDHANMALIGRVLWAPRRY